MQWRGGISNGLLTTTLVVWFALLAAGGCRPNASRQSVPAGGVAMRWQKIGESERLEVVGLPREVLDAARRHANISNDNWSRILAMYVEVGNGDHVPPMLGEYSIDSDTISFTPKFELRPGMTYRQMFDPGPLAELTKSALKSPATFPTERIEMLMTQPAPPRVPATKVTAVYPSSDVLPENQLKFYIHFSAPMGRGESYQHVKLLKSSGEEVPSPFLELEEELWDGDLQRFTLIFEPGRVKRGLMLREEIGPALVAGEEYELVVDSAWRDAAGNPLAESFRKRFRVGPQDTTQPNPKLWKVTPPKAGTRDHLVVEFNEPLDRAMLERVIQVISPSYKFVFGDIEIDRGETVWRYTPFEPWKAGHHALFIEGTLEDLAGNSIGRPFEVLLESKDKEVPKEGAYHLK